MCLRWRNLNELMREEYYHQQFGERRTRNGINGNNGTENNTEGANLVDDNKNISNNKYDIDNNNQDVGPSNQNICDNNQNADGNNQDNQDIHNNQQDVDNKKQDIDDNNQVTVIDIAKESDEMSPFWSEECSSNNEDHGIQQKSSPYCMDTFQVIAEVHTPCITETLV